MADEPTQGAAPKPVDSERPKLQIKPKPKPKLKIKAKPVPSVQEREQSTIQFAYMDLETAISVAAAILRGGGVAVTKDQLAGVMNLAAGSGNFVLKLATARMFGLITFNAGKYELTNLGFNILDSDEARQKAARKDAFLTVPLYRRTFDEFRGKQLPPRPHGLEQAFVKFGVAQKQKQNARLAFDKSAMQAGFFLNGPDRLIEPIISGAARSAAYVDEDDSRGDEPAAPTPASGPIIDVTGRHPFIQGLLDTLPEPQTNWAAEGRAKWLMAAANIFDLIYKGTGHIDIRVLKADPTASG